MQCAMRCQPECTKEPNLRRKVSELSLLPIFACYSESSSCIKSQRHSSVKTMFSTSNIRCATRDPSCMCVFDSRYGTFMVSENTIVYCGICSVCWNWPPEPRPLTLDAHTKPKMALPLVAALMCRYGSRPKRQQRTPAPQQ